MTGARPRPGSAANPDAAVDRWILRQLAQTSPRAKSLVVTVWGDSIAPHGGAVWLSGLFGLLEPLGINERLVRTSVYRLAREGWLVARQEGRRSLYRLTPQGERRFEHAYRRIYAPPSIDPWDGAWNLLIVPPGSIEEPTRRELRKELEWDGFGVVAPGVFARPVRAGDELALKETVLALGISARVAIAAATGLPRGAGSIASLARDCWDLKSVAAAYRGFVTRFRRVAQQLDHGARPDPRQCFVVRTLLIHEFRRVTLHDPQLPAELLPSNWPEAEAYALCAALYRRVHRGAERYLTAVIEKSPKSRESAAAHFQERFGGLQAP